MSGCIAVINAGSSSVKFALYEVSSRCHCPVPRAGRRNRCRTAPDNPGRTRRGRRQAGMERGRVQPRCGDARDTDIGSGSDRGNSRDRHRTSRCARRDAIRCTGPPGPGCAGVAFGAYATRALAPAAQPGSDSDNPRCGTTHPTGCLLRHSVPSRPAASGSVFCIAARSHERGHPTLWLPWPVIRIPGLRIAREAIRHRAIARHHGAPGQRRQPVRRQGWPKCREHDGIHRR